VFGGIYCKQEAASASYISRYLTKSVEMSDGSLTLLNVTLFQHRFDGSWKKRKQVYEMGKKTNDFIFMIPFLNFECIFHLSHACYKPRPYLSL